MESNTAFFELSKAYPHVDTSSADAVACVLFSLHEEIFPNELEARLRLQKGCAELQRLFNGGFPNFQPVDTPYHDLEHTLQVTLCLARLLKNAIKRDRFISSELFERALVAAFFHDVGYFKKEGDKEGTGAKYTAHHELRGALMAATYLYQKNWAAPRIYSIQRLILSTSPDRAIRAILFADEDEAFLGAALCSADLLAQMSDPRYLKRLPLLYAEFQESDAFLEVPHTCRSFPTLEALLDHTALFWDQVLNKRLIEDCQSVYRYLEEPLMGINPYIRAIEAHLKVLKHSSRSEKNRKK